MFAAFRLAFIWENKKKVRAAEARGEVEGEVGDNVTAFADLTDMQNRMTLQLPIRVLGGQVKVGRCFKSIGLLRRKCMKGYHCIDFPRYGPMSTAEMQ